MTIQDISDAIDSARCKGSASQSVIFRPYGNGPSWSFVELSYSLVRSALDEIARKIPFVSAGIDEFSAAEKVMFQMFVLHAKYQGYK